MKRSSMRGGQRRRPEWGRGQLGPPGKVCGERGRRGFPRRHPGESASSSTITPENSPHRHPGPEVTMAAEGLPAGTPPSTLPIWELEAWYQDLQEVLAASEPCGPSTLWGAEQAKTAPPWSTEGAGSELDTALAAELLELESTAGSEPGGVLDGAPSSSPPAQPGRGVKRKRCGGTGAGRELAKHQERANEQRVLELTAQNEELRAEIHRLSAEVERTRAALIDRMVNLRGCGHPQQP